MGGPGLLLQFLRVVLGDPWSFCERSKAALGPCDHEEQEGDAQGPEQEELWPFFFEAGDVERMWAELGEHGVPCPPIQAIDLAQLVQTLLGPRAVTGARPVVCAPLDSVEYLRAREWEAAKLAAEAAEGRQGA